MRGGGGGGMFDRHRGPDDEAPWPADPGMGRGRGRGFERSLSSGAGGPGGVISGGPGGPGGPVGPGGPPPGEDALLNGSVSPRKGYTRAPFADWRKSAAVTNEDEWRSAGAPSGRRWNQVGVKRGLKARRQLDPTQRDRKSQCVAKTDGLRKIVIILFRPAGGVVAPKSGAVAGSTVNTPTAWADLVDPRPTQGGSKSRTIGWVAVAEAGTTEGSAPARLRAPGTETWTTCPSGRLRTIPVQREAGVLTPTGSLRRAPAEGRIPAEKNQDNRVSGLVIHIRLLQRNVFQFCRGIERLCRRGRRRGRRVVRRR